MVNRYLNSHTNIEFIEIILFDTKRQPKFIIILLIIQLTTIQFARTTSLQKRSYDIKQPFNAQNVDSSELPDLHDSQFCTDISSWGPIEWSGKTVEKCNTTFIKKQKNRWKKVIGS